MLEKYREFEKIMPFLFRWLDREIQKAQKLPSKVERANIPRGEVYPLTRSKTLLALFRAVTHLLKFDLKELAVHLKVPYGTVRNWSREKRVRDKRLAFAAQYTDEFVDKWRFTMTAVRMDGSGGWPLVKRDEIRTMIREAANFNGFILQLFLEKMNQLFETDPIVRTELYEFSSWYLDELIPDRPSNIKEYYRLVGQIEMEGIRSKFDMVRWQMDDALDYCTASIDPEIKAKREPYLATQKRNLQGHLQSLKENSLDTRERLSKTQQEYWSLLGYVDFLKKADKREFKKFER